MTGAVLERRALGRRLRALRNETGMSRSAAGKVIESSVQTVGRLEDGTGTRISGIHVSLLCDAYKATVTEREVLLRLAGEVRTARKARDPWWRAYKTMAVGGFADRIVFEQAASTVSTFHTTLIPGLLHTADYHRAAQHALHPHESAADLDHRVEMTLRRQEILHNNDFHAKMYLLQSVLQHSVGSPAVMDRQLSYLDRVAQLPNVSIRIIPHAAGGHIGLHLSSFDLLEFGLLPATGQPEPPIVYVKGLTRELRLEQDNDIARYRAALTDLDRAALDEDQSRALMSRIADGRTGMGPTLRRRDISNAR